MRQLATSMSPSDLEWQPYTSKHAAFQSLRNAWVAQRMHCTAINCCCKWSLSQRCEIASDEVKWMWQCSRIRWWRFIYLFACFFIFLWLESYRWVAGRCRAALISTRCWYWCLCIEKSELTIPAMHATLGVHASTLCISLPNSCSALGSLQLWCLWGRSRSCFPRVLGMLFRLLSSFSWLKRNAEMHRISL